VDPIFRVTKDDPEMLAAIRQAHETFPDFLREADADLARAIPILVDAMVKIYVPDPKKPETGEHLWGRYLNTPRRLKKILAKGDQLDFSIRSLSDWLYVTDDRAFGAFTVRLLRSRMTRAERKKHDAAYPFSFD
jgi:uncharacterized protein YegJ (DUF2314 family)